MSTSTSAPCPSTKSTSGSSACAISQNKLLTWKDPVRTGKVLGAIVAALVVVKTVNIVPVFFYTLAAVLALSAAVEYVSTLVTGSGIVTKYRPTKATIGPCFKETVLPQLGKAVALGEHIAQVTVFSVDPCATLKTAGVSYILYKITSWFSLFTIVATGVVLAFTVPVIYVTYQKEIDSAVSEYSSLAKEKADEVYKVAHKKAAPYATQFVEKTGPVGSFVKSKFPVRTAGATVNAPAPVAEPEFATSTGAAKFPDVPESQLKSNVEKAAAAATAAVEEPAVKADLPQPTEY